MGELTRLFGDDKLRSLTGRSGLERAIQDGTREAAAAIGSVSRTPYHEDAWKFVRDCVWTLDEARPEEPVRQFPSGACKACGIYCVGSTGKCAKCEGEAKPIDYFRLITEQWVKRDPPILAVPKPRRMRMSWLFCALHTWLACTSRGVAAYLISTKEEKSKELIERCVHILRHVPTTLLKVPRWEYYVRPPRIVFPALQSKIVGIGEGPDQLRQFTATAVMCDEIAFWRWPRSSFTAIKPTIEGGGRIVLLSSANPGFFKQLVGGEIQS
jgi:hypothetical protein